MTPLAQSIVRQLALPAKKRTFNDDPPGLMQKISAAHCFETTAIVPLVDQLMHADEDVHEMSDQEWATWVAMAKQTAFLPSPRTWIEFVGSDRIRYGFLLLDDVFRSTSGDVWITVNWVDQTAGCLLAFSIPQRDDLEKGIKTHLDIGAAGTMDDEQRQLLLTTFATRIIAILAIINTPKIVSQRTHPPHAGLQRDLARVNNAAGALEPWHEVLLHVNVPAQFADDAKDTHLTGTRALHFCRSFLRVRLGHIELVRAHWRGDPTLGIKQTRYRVAGSPTSSDHD